MIRPDRSSAGQLGFSLIEVLLAIVVSVALIIPLGAWTVLALRQQPVVEDDLVTTSSMGLLGIHLPNDVRVAAAAAHDENNDEVEFTDCIGGPGSDGTEVLLVLHIADIEPRKVVYKEAALRDGGAPDPTRRSIWRRECALNDQFDTSATEVLLGVEPGAASADCPSLGPTATCRHVRFDVGLPGQEPFLLRATRRVDAASLRFDRAGNRLPVAKIKVLSQSGHGPFTVTLSPEGSEDPDGEIVQYEWSIPLAPYTEGTPTVFEDPPRLDPVGAQQVVAWGQPGVYFVQLAVTDDQGAVTTAYKRIVVGRAGVVADLKVEPASGVAELTEFAFTASWTDEDGDPAGSQAPPGRALRYEWVIRSPLPDPFDDEGNLLSPPPTPGPDTQFTTVRNDPGTFRSALPGSMVRVSEVAGNEFEDGLVEVQLTVYDALEPDARDTVVYPIRLTRPAASMLPPQLDESAPDDPVAVGVVTREGESENWRLDASGSQPGSTGDPLAQYRWDFGPTMEIVETPEADLLVTDLLPGGGWFQYLLTVTDQAGRRGQVVGTHVDGRPLATAPQVGFADGRVSWPEVPGAAGYRIVYSFEACGLTAESSYAQGHRSGTMSLPVPPSRCADPGPVRARVFAQHPAPTTPGDEESTSAASEVVVQTELLALAGGA